MRIRNILTFALVGLLLTALISPNVFAAKYNQATISEVNGNRVGQWMQDIWESIAVSYWDSLHNQNTFCNHGDRNLGRLDLYRLSSTNDGAGLNPSLQGRPDNVGISVGNSYSYDSVVTLDSSARGTTHTLCTSHYYYPRSFPGQVYYPSYSATKQFQIV